MKIGNLIENKSVNYPLAVVVWVISFLIMFLILHLAGWDNKIMIGIIFILTAFVGFGDLHNVGLLGKQPLLYLGQPTGIWLDSGYYFLFWIFTLGESEAITIEKKDVIVAPFACQDKNGKGVTCEANGDWRIVDEQKYILQDATKMESNLQALIRRTGIRICGGKVYHTHILGADLGEAILGDGLFQRECKKYGIEFSNLIADGIASDLTQENINSYYNELFILERKKYPANRNLTHQELNDIEDRIQVKMKLANKIISNSPTLGMFNVPTGTTRP
jgi:hypothetical protein